MRKIILLLIFLSLSSCVAESIQFKMKNSLKVYNNEVTVRLTPKKRNVRVFVSYYDTLIETSAPKKPRVFRIVHNKKAKIYRNTTLENYQDIIDSFHKINEDVMKFPKESIDSNGVKSITFGSLDAPSVSIFYKKGRTKKMIRTYNGLSIEYQYFYTTSKMILEQAKISIDSVDSFGEKRKIIK